MFFNGAPAGLEQFRLARRLNSVEFLDLRFADDDATVITDPNLNQLRSYAWANDEDVQATLGACAMQAQQTKTRNVLLHRLKLACAMQAQQTICRKGNVVVGGYPGAEIEAASASGAAG